VQGLVAQGRTINETIEIAKDVARKLLEARGQEGTLKSILNKANVIAIFYQQA
jgi:hypothetical protein